MLNTYFYTNPKENLLAITTTPYLVKYNTFCVKHKNNCHVIYCLIEVACVNKFFNAALCSVISIVMLLIWSTFEQELFRVRDTTRKYVTESIGL